MYTRMIHCYNTDDTNNKFSISFMIKPSLKFNNVFIIKVEKCSSLSYSARNMKAIKYCMMKKNTCVMALIMIYENNGEIPKQNVQSVMLCYLFPDRELCLY